MSTKNRWYLSAATVLALGVAALVWSRSKVAPGEESVRSIASPGASIAIPPRSGTPAPVSTGAVDPMRAVIAASAGSAEPDDVLVQGLQGMDAPDERSKLPPWQRAHEKASTQWAQDPRLAELNQSVRKELVDIESWFRQHPPLRDWSQVGPERMKRVTRHSSELGQRVISGECRVGVCRLEVEHDPTSPKHARVRPAPRVRRHADGSVMVRYMQGESIRTIFFLNEKHAPR